MNWKSFKEYIPYLSGLIILLGLIRQMVYYNRFDIPIQNYIGVSELLLAWMEESVIFFISIFMLIGYSKFLSIDSNFNLNKLGKFLIPLFTLWLLYELIHFLLVKEYITSIPFLILIFLSFYPVAGWIFNSVLKRTPIKLANFQFIYFSICVILFLVLVTRNSIKNVDNGRYTGTKIYTNDSTYISDSSHYFIGKTEKYYFIYNKDIKSTMVIPEREVSKFELKSQR